MTNSRAFIRPNNPRILLINAKARKSTNAKNPDFNISISGYRKLPLYTYVLSAPVRNI